MSENPYQSPADVPDEGFEPVDSGKLSLADWLGVVLRFLYVFFFGGALLGSLTRVVLPADTFEEHPEAVLLGAFTLSCLLGCFAANHAWHAGRLRARKRAKIARERREAIDPARLASSHESEE